jgi:prevent-host-death family protein
MRTINFTEFRKRASGLMTEVERGETILVIRHGRPIAEVSPVSGAVPSWKQSALRLTSRGVGLASAIIEDRADEVIS